MEDWKKAITNDFRDALVVDEVKSNQPRQVYNAHYSDVNPTPSQNPRLISANSKLAQELKISPDYLRSEEFVTVFSGNSVLPNNIPYAMCYGGHQFGQWAGQLGDGRAINLFELNRGSVPYQIQLKGAGPTPYSRSADGRAVLRSSVREYLMSEAMHHLGVPTTRALSLMLTGDKVLRDMMYDGNAAYEKGAVVCRVAPTFIRFGNFQILAARKDFTNLQRLADYTILTFFPHLKHGSKDGYIEWFKEVTNQTLEMVLHWQRVGFVHGVMNTDNMSILGLTIDYGPYGWLDNYDPDWTPNTTDNQMKRYRFGHQPYIAQWNLAQLANAIYPLIEESEPLIEILNHYKQSYQSKYMEMMCEKLGLSIPSSPKKVKLIQSLDQLMISSNIDFTMCFRLLSTITNQNSPEECYVNIIPSFYQEKLIGAQLKSDWFDWFTSYQDLISSEKPNSTIRKKNMDQINPKYVLRNYMAQIAIDEAEKENYSILDELYQMLLHPYDEQPQHQQWFAKRPEWAKNKIGCSALSCSS